MFRLTTPWMMRVGGLLAVATILASCGGPAPDDASAPAPTGTEENAPLSNAPSPDKTFAAVADVAPPMAEKRPVEIEQFGETRVDNYAWMRDENWQDVLRDPSGLRDDIREHLDAENAYYAKAMAPLASLKERLFAEMKGRLKEDDASVPTPDGEYAYWARYRQGGEYPIFVRTPRDGGAETILFDGDAEAKANKDAGFDFFNISNVAHSPNHTLIAFAVDNVGSEYFTIRVRNIATGETFADVVTNAGDEIIWAADSASFFYIERDANQRPKKVKRHVLGADPSGDETLYEEADDAYFLSVDKSQSGEYIFITASKSTTSEVRYFKADSAPGTAPALIEERQEGLLYEAEHRGDHFYIHTNADGAVDFKVMRTPTTSPGRKSWKEWLEARRGVYVPYFIPFKDKVARVEVRAALPRLVVSDWSLVKEEEITFDEAAYHASLRAGYEFDTNTLRFAYESPSTPQEIYDYDMETGERVLLKTEEVPSGHDKDLYVVERRYFNTEDRRPIPVTILRLKDTKPTPDTPLLLYGYGSYGISLRADFNTNVLSLVDRGVIFAQAHVRGGADRGRQWYLDGKLDKKENTFNDLITVAASLQSSGMTSPKKTVIYGGSAGGLLVGATVNKEPARFAGIIAAVPFVDVLNTISDETLPLTPPEWSEWGDPIRDEAAYNTIKAYSPYENIKGGEAYPAILATAGLADYRVTYWEPAKWVARLRDEATGGPFFLHTNMEAGHAGAAARFERLKEYADYYAFALEVFNATEAAPIAHGSDKK